MESNIDLFIQILILIGITLIIIVIGGMIIDYIQKVSNTNLQRGLGKFAVIITGLGTVVHELSHLLFVYLGGMKPTSVKLFRPIKGVKDGTLGYVEYAYNKKNWYQRMSLVLVAISPIFGGISVIILALKILFPELYIVTASQIDVLLNNINGINIQFIKGEMVIVNEFSTNLFTINNFSKVEFWIFIFIIFSISSCMSLSSTDIESGVKGIPIFLIVLFFFSLIVSMLGLNNMINILNSINIYLLIFMGIGIVFSLLNMFISLIIGRVLK